MIYESCSCINIANFILLAELLEPDEDLTGVNIEEDVVQNELHSALSKARKVNLKRKKPPTLQVPFLQLTFSFTCLFTAILWSIDPKGT